MRGVASLYIWSSWLFGSVHIYNKNYIAYIYICIYIDNNNLYKNDLLHHNTIYIKTNIIIIEDKIANKHTNEIKVCIIIVNVI